MAVLASGLRVEERGFRESRLGRVLQLKIYEPGYRDLTWLEVEQAFQDVYPGRWAVQLFPPLDRVVNGKAVYHLFVLEAAPVGLDLR